MDILKSEYFSKYTRRDYFENSKIWNLKMCKAEICETDVQISLRQEILNYNLGTNWWNLKLNFSDFSVGLITVVFWEILERIETAIKFYSK